MFLTVDCGSLSAPTNGVVMTTGTTLSSTATYICNTGYTRSEDQTRVCLASGDWSRSEPACNREYCLTINITYNHVCCLAVDCGTLTINNGQVSTTSGTTFGSTATYTCNTGYNRVGGSMTRTCQADRIWSGAAPTCDGEIIKV